MIRIIALYRCPNAGSIHALVDTDGRLYACVLHRRVAWCECTHEAITDPTPGTVCRHLVYVGAMPRAAVG